MERKDMAKFSVVVALVVVAALLFVFVTRILNSKTAAVELAPLSDAGDVSPQPDRERFDNAIFVEVTPETVQSVVATLHRPESYARTLTLSSYWTRGDGSTGSGTVTVQVWADGGYTRTAAALAGGRVRNQLTGGGTTYLWYDGDRTCRSFASGGADGDLAQQIPTYEDLLAVDQADISAAGFETKDGVDCIYAQAVLGELGYTQRFWVSIASGLLLASETYDGDTLLRTVSGPEVTIPSGAGAERYTLPEGTVVYSPEG